MSTKKYWKGIEELNNTTEFLKHQQNEFAEELPVQEFLGDTNIEHTKASRRDFLKFLGFSTVAATLASCEAPVRKAIPYINKPQDVTPGVANYYASAFFDGYEYCGLLVKTREGRPIKIEGNDQDPLTKGGTNARVQGSIISLYDTMRYKAPMIGGKASDWKTLDQAVVSGLNASSSKSIVLLSSSIASPSTLKAFEVFKAKYPTATLVQYDAVSYDAIKQAHQVTHGKSVIPSYQFDQADVIVSIGADFLAHWLSPIQFANQYGKTRKVDAKQPKMSHHVQIETQLSLTGSNADVRIPVKPSQQALSVLNLFKALQGGAPAKSISKSVDAKILKAAQALVAAKGKALVVCGVNDKATQVVVNKINALLGAYGSTIQVNQPLLTKNGDDVAVQNLIGQMEAGQVGALIAYNCNPAYTLGESFKKALTKVATTISLSTAPNETSALCKFVAPDHHFLESWNDVNPQQGLYALTQPTINPLFSTRQAQESFLNWGGQSVTYYDFLQKNWLETILVDKTVGGWNQALYTGFITSGALSAPSSTEPSNKSLPQEKVAPVAVEALPTSELGGDYESQILAASMAKGGEVFIYEKVGMGVGQYTNNPFLQELPDPISKVTWDNYITMNPEEMVEKGLSTIIGQESPADLIELTVGTKKIKLPALAQPGQVKGTYGIALGYGRTEGVVKTVNDMGANAFPIVTFAGTNFKYWADNASISNSIEKYPLAATQTHHTLMGRDMVKETNLDAYKLYNKTANPDKLLVTNLPEIDAKDGVIDGKAKLDNVNLWQDYQNKNHFWNLSIDLNSCIGCGACVVACNVENNVPVVGKDEVRRSREMHWLRIDRYYSSDTKHEELDKESGPFYAKDIYHKMEVPSKEETLEVVFQPMMCHHCNHAPCETVCPVLATTHSLEGYNMMTYNRCIGTRYCANNCPYKVRRFNWFNYTTNDQFKDVNIMQIDDLGRMVLNPDVTVRSRGVMEKCSMCVQRIQEGKLQAKKEARRPVDGEIKMACQQSCPTHAISFGDWNDTASEVRQLSENERTYFVLEEIGVQPSVHFMTKIRNKENAELVAQAKSELEAYTKKVAASEKAKKAQEEAHKHNQEHGHH